MKAQKLNRRQARWLLYLSRFDFTLKYVASKSMGRADSLSRKVDWTKEVERDNENQVVLKERRVYVLKNKKLRVEIIWLHHDTPIAGYREQWKTVELVTRNYWWPGVAKEVK